MANGENPKRAHKGPDKPPATRMGVAFLERKLFVEALDYRARWERHRKQNKGDPPARDLRLEPMLEVLSGARVVHHHTHRADDILTVLRIREEFGHRVVLQHATEAYLQSSEVLALALQDIDTYMDGLHSDLFAAVFQTYSEGRTDFQVGVQLALVGRFYERIGDHAVNIGEHTAYIVSGEFPRHIHPESGNEVPETPGDT